MKKLITVVCFVLVLIPFKKATAQLRANAYYGYVFDDKFDSYYDSYSYYRGKIKGSGQWGVGLEYLKRGNYCELLYLRQSTTAPTTYADGIFTSTDNFDMKLNYILIGGGHSKALSNKAEVFGGVMAGLGIISIEGHDGRGGTTEKFSWGAKLGATIWVTNKVGIKLQTQLTSPVQAAGGSLFFGSSGSSVGVSTYSTIYQFALGGGLTFKLL